MRKKSQRSRDTMSYVFLLFLICAFAFNGSAWAQDEAAPVPAEGMMEPS